MNRTSVQGRGVVRESRPHDYLYDPNYTMCSQKDFYKQAAIGARSGARLKLRPVFPSMFSERRTDHRIEVCLVLPSPNVLENFMPQRNICGVPVLPMQDDCVYRREIEPTGADRAIFVTGYNAPTYVTARPQMQPHDDFDFDQEKGSSRGRKSTHYTHRKGFFVNQSVQTDYRESETQTDPYSPPYTLPHPHAYPKVLALLKMTWGKGLPATLEDIVIIERALTRRMLEIGVHDADDEDAFARRVKLMEELEAQQWADRERELNLILDYKMKLTAKALADLKAKARNTLTNKMEHAFEISRREVASQLAKIRHNYLRAVRRAENSIIGTEKQILKGYDITKQCLESDSKKSKSKVCPPPPGRDPSAPSKYKLKDSLQIEDFCALTEDPDFVKNELECNKARLAKRLAKVQVHASAKHKRLEAKLGSIYEAFCHEMNKKTKEDESTFMRQVIMSTVQRMRTPTISEHDLAREHEELCALDLEKVIRGRAVQAVMQEEMKQNMSTTLELKALHKADPYGLKTTYGPARAQANMQEDREMQQEKQNDVTEIVDQLEGETLSRMFDFLEKEMVRLLDERKIHALMILAERERRMREATEGGRRQKEEEERRIHDEIFRQVVGVHQATVDMYLEDMYLEAIHRAADSGAREYVQGLARTINEAAYITNQSYGDMDKEQMAADLVHCFILPEMNRLYHAQRLDAVSARYTTVAVDVTDTTIGAQVVINETLDSILPTIRAHTERGEAVADATQIVVESVIKEAVASMFGGIHATATKAREAEGEGEDEEEGEAELRPDNKISSAAAADKVKLDPVAITETVRSTIGDEELGEPVPASESAPTSRVQIVSRPVDYIPVSPDFKLDLGAMSLEISQGADMERETIELYNKVADEVEEIFDQTRETAVPSDVPESDKPKQSEKDFDTVSQRTAIMK